MRLNLFEKKINIEKYLEKVCIYNSLSTRNKLKLDNLFEKIMRNVGNYFERNMSEEEAHFVICYLAQTYKEKYVEENLVEDLHINIEDLPIGYNGKFKTTYLENEENDFDNKKNVIFLSNSIEYYLIYGNKEEFRIAISTIFHELTHYNQTIKVKNITTDDFDKYSLKEMKKYYQIALEKSFRIFEDSYYDNNYKFSFTENDANIQGVLLTNELMKKYLKKDYQYNSEELREIIKKMKTNFYQSNLNIYGKEFEEGMKCLNIFAITILKNQKNILKEFPITKLAFNEDGSVKDLTTILDDRQSLIEQLGEEKLKEINDLYLLIYNSINYSNSKETDLSEIIQYIITKSDKDRFIMGILRKKLSLYKDKDDAREIVFDILKKYNKVSNFNKEFIEVEDSVKLKRKIN